MAACRNCALELARIVSQRHWWFRYVRTPLVWGMRGLAWWHDYDPSKHPVRQARCTDCLRFRKNLLEEKSPTFRFLNGLVGKSFSSLRDIRLTETELAEAKTFAREATSEAGDRPA
jgi:hypothetical protein